MSEVSGASGCPDWDRVDELFQLALDLAEPERQSFLNRMCRSQGNLKREVVSLLEAYEGASRFLERSPLEQFAGNLRIGPYQVTKELARGGMGTVFLARLVDDPSPRDFAVKVINTDLESEVAARRFAQEQQILATLEHPNIARFLEGGTTPDGRPFLVMEYIRGEPIDRYCDRLRLSIDERLDLFLEVCLAVQHAHQKLVVHRDLKPNNVLVTEQGVPKLLDFGTAKLLDPALRLSGLTATATGLFLMTPSYASPEQVRGEGISTLSDVYGLGALLYELLTGQRAHRLTSRSPAEILRVVCEQETLRPSWAVATAREGQVGRESREEIARRRSTQPARLKRDLEGDLDRILLLALRKEPEQRYGSVEQFADDLQRHRKGLPVVAAPSSYRYRARKFVRRHRTAAAVLFVVWLSLVIFTGQLVLHSQRTEQGKESAELERRKAEAVSTFLVELFDHRYFETAEDVGTVLDRGVERLKRNFPSPPEVRAGQLEALGQGYRRLGLYQQAAPLLREALELRQRRFGPEHLDTASSFHELGLLLWKQGEMTEAKALMERGLATRERLAGRDSQLVADSLEGLFKPEAMARLAGAEALGIRVLELRRRHLPPDHPKVALALSSLGMYQVQLLKFRQGLRSLEEALAIHERVLGAEDPRTGESALRLGGMLSKVGEYRRAEELLLRALEIYRRALGPEHPGVAACHGQLGNLYYELLDLDRSEVEMQAALKLTEERFGVDSPWTADAHLGLGLVFYQRGELRLAEARFEHAFELYSRPRARDGLYASVPLHFLAVLARLEGEYSRAEALLGRVLKIRQKRLPPSHPEIATTVGEKGLLELDQGNAEAARALLHRSLVLRRNALGEDHLLVAASRSDLASAQIALADLEAAQGNLAEAWRVRARALGEDHALTRATARRLEVIEDSSRAESQPLGAMR
ncbi:MAG: serine/threonine-protein kinase [Deltaproteobacteria bacterium]|nr:serine/threonine-protein kinase [Deltaproteobacteria bacterium]